MCHVYQGSLLHLGVALLNPGGKTCSVQVRVRCKRRVNSMDDEVEEVGFIGKVALRAGRNHPTGAAHVEHCRSHSPKMGKEMSPGSTVSRWFARNDAPVHRLVIESLNCGIQCRVDLWLEDRRAVKSDREVK